MTDKEIDVEKWLEEMKNYIPTEEEIHEAEQEQQEEIDSLPFDDLGEQLGERFVYVADGVWWDCEEKKFTRY